jgi:hypothetical protein
MLDADYLSCAEPLESSRPADRFGNENSAEAPVASDFGQLGHRRDTETRQTETPGAELAGWWVP